MKTATIAALLGLAIIATAGNAQTTTAPEASASKFGGLSSMLGGALPNVASTGASNAAGVLGYCVKNNVLSGANAASVLGSLTGKTGIATSPAYAAGQAGTLQAGKSTMSLANMKGQVKTKVCDLVLKRAKSFL